MPTLGSPRKHRGKIIILTALGLLLLGVSLTIRLLDRPRDVEPVEQADETYSSQFFGVGLTVGDFKDLGCSGLCPTSLIFEYDDAEPDRVTGKFLGTLEGTQAGTEPAKILLVAPEGASDFVLVDDTSPAIEMTVETVTLTSSGSARSGDKKVSVAVLNVPSLSDIGFFGVTFSWRPGTALTDAGIGRKNLRIAYSTSHPALDQEGAYSLDVADPAESLKDVGVEVNVSGASIGSVIPDPDGRPTPRSVLWRVGTSQSEEYYVVTLEHPSLRFWVDLVNEQTLFIAGLLLGAVIGAVASEWFTSPSRVLAGSR
jgi:hypothetical protein